MGSLLTILTGLTAVLTQANVAVPTAFTLIQAVRDAWPHKTVDPNDPNSGPVPTNVELIAIMRAGFAQGHSENLEKQADLQAQIDALEAQHT